MEFRLGRALNPIHSFQIFPSPLQGWHLPNPAGIPHVSHSLGSWSLPSIPNPSGWRKFQDFMALFPLFFRYHLEFPSRGESGWGGLDWETFPVLNSQEKEFLWMCGVGKVPQPGSHPRERIPQFLRLWNPLLAWGRFPETPGIWRGLGRAAHSRWELIGRFRSVPELS